MLRKENHRIAINVLHFRIKTLMLLGILLVAVHQLPVAAQTEPNPVLPDTLFIALGNSIELYNDDVAFVQLGSSSYTFNWVYDVGSTDSDKWYWTSDQLGTFNLKFECYQGGTLVDQVSSIIEVNEKVTDSNYTLLTIGNSLTSSGIIYQFDQITEDVDFSISTIGTLGTSVKHEGHGGWLFKTFLGSDSPFYFNGISVRQYLSSNGFPDPDVVRISLGINDCFLSESMSNIFQQADELIAECREDLPQALIVIAMPTLCENSGDGWILKYGSLDNYERYQLRIRELWRHLLTTYTGPNGTSYVQVSYDGLCIDRDEGYPKDATGTHIEGVHPNVLGYKQLIRGFSNVMNHYLWKREATTDKIPPSTPTGLQTLTITESSISVSWNASSDNVGVTGYRIYADGNQVGLSQLPSFTLTDLEGGTSYSITVSAFDAASNESERSPPLVVTTDTPVDNSAPSIPSGLEVVGITQTSIHLIWEPSTDNVGVSGYRVFVNSTENGTTASTSWVLSGLTPGTEYTFSVSAFDNSSNESQPSSPIAVTTLEVPDTEAPTAPTELQAIEVRWNSIELEWIPSTDNVVVSGYRIFSNGLEQGTSVNPHYVITDLDPDNEYDLSVTAFDASSNESPMSEVLSTSTLALDDTPPSVPSGLILTSVTDNAITIIWDHSTDNVAVAGYSIYVNGSFNGSSLANSYTITQLTSGVLYEFYVIAYDERNNESEPSDTLQVRTVVVDTESPSIPAGLVATQVASTTISLAWNASQDNTGVAGYHIYVDGFQIGESLTNSYTVTELSAGINYEISVTAYDELLNESTHSSALRITTTHPDQLEPPVLPVLDISHVTKVNNTVETITRMHSYGYTELVNYGLLVKKDTDSLENAEAYYVRTEDQKLFHEGRVTDHLQLFYDFTKKFDNQVVNLSESEGSYNLTIEPSFNTSWLPLQGLRVIENTLIYSKNAVSELIDSVKSTNEITLEAWLNPATIEQHDPSNVISLLSDTTSLLFALEHKGSNGYYDFTMRLSTDATDNQGNPAISTSSQMLHEGLRHIIFTRDAFGDENLYLNGIKVYSHTRAGDVSNWNTSNRLEISNLHSALSPWIGTFYLLAIYNNALNESEVQANYNAGIGYVDYLVDLKNLTPGNTYHLFPFAQTDHGLSIGDSAILVIEGEEFQSKTDSIYIEIYPNPSDGRFRVYFENFTFKADDAILKISDFSGHVVFTKAINLSDIYYSTEVELDVSHIIQPGMYSLMITIGSNSSARKLLIL